MIVLGSINVLIPGLVGCPQATLMYECTRYIMLVILPPTYNVESNQINDCLIKERPLKKCFFFKGATPWADF